MYFVDERFGYGTVEEYSRSRDDRLVSGAFYRKFVKRPADIVASVVRDRLEQQTGKEVRLVKVTNPDIIGGMILVIEDRIVDGSIRHRLDGSFVYASRGFDEIFGVDSQRLGGRRGLPGWQVIDAGERGYFSTFVGRKPEA